MYSNNVDPILLPGGKTFLALGHEHLGRGGATRYWNEYLHMFVEFESVYPYRVKGKSPKFCFPPLSRNDLCDLIQFAMSMWIEGSKLVITYGVNDCETRLVELELEEVLGSVRA